MSDFPMHKSTFSDAGSERGSFVANYPYYQVDLLPRDGFMTAGGGVVLKVTYDDTDTSGPTVSFQSNSSNWTSNNVTVSYTANDPSNVIKVEHCFSTSSTTPTSGWTVAYNNSTGVSTYNGSATISSTGQWYLHIRATDKLNNVSNYRSSGTYKIDKTTPTFSASPTSLGWTSANASATVGVSYGISGLLSCQYAWSTSTTTPSSGWTNLSYSGGSVSQTTEGIWYLHLRMTNGASVSASTYYGPYRIDKTAPSVSANPTGQSPVGGAVSPTVSATDVRSGIATIQYAWTTSTTKPSSGWQATTSGSQVPKSDSGTWYLHVEATDNAGLKKYAYYGPYLIQSLSGGMILADHLVTLRKFINDYDSFYGGTSATRYTTAQTTVSSVREEKVAFSGINSLRNNLATLKKISISWTDPTLSTGIMVKAIHFDEMNTQMGIVKSTCWTCDLCHSEGATICKPDYGCGSDGHQCSCDWHYWPGCNCDYEMCHGDFYTCPANIIECSSCQYDSGGSCQCYGNLGGYTSCNCYGNAGCQCYSETCAKCDFSYNRMD